jgi:KAP family P-loop domain/TIR domain
MASEASPSESARDDESVYHAYIAYAPPDAEWAGRLARDLTHFGLRVFADLQVGRDEAWRVVLDRELTGTGALIVLWTPAASASKALLSDIGDFQAIHAWSPARRLVPVVFGGTDALGAAPLELRSPQSVMVSDDVYAQGPRTKSDEWDRAVLEIATAVQASSLTEADAPTSTALPRFSASARRALTYAAQMLGDDSSPSQLRTAVLLGALRESALGGMTPTTGDIVKLALSRQSGGRDAEELLAAAALRAGLDLGEPLEERSRLMSVDALRSSAVRELVDDAIQVQRRTGADRVHLRHVFATGTHPAVPSAVMAELGVAMSELRSAWRASIARTWPDESQDAWDEILIEELQTGPFANAPPSARVHADRWTTDDRLDYALYAKAIAEFIRHPDAKPPMVISVQAPWGQGKTSLMRMVQRELDPEHPDLEASPNAAAGPVEPPSKLTFRELRDSLDATATVDPTAPPPIPTVWFNAWKYQSTEQIWAGLAHAILAQLSARLSARDRELFWLRSPTPSDRSR